MKVIGFINMKKKDGKVVFVTDQNVRGVTGESCDKIFLYDDLAKKVTEQSIGKEMTVQYGRGYSGSAYVQDITIK